MLIQKILGIIFVILGPFLIIKTEWILENFGPIEWAEDKLRTSGGSRFFYKMVGLLMIFFGMAMVLGLFEGMVLWVFGPLLPK
ncbi:MAG: hypothetical protein A2Y82_05290 [Candidatus Buchananbacteria bacterium RBG_13_36_9]|jgi:hypothetical protein|uniref:DUF3784 domain-containing protein n=1 Tax=Candidatus Buchananbacteria bacterium RBG_13_36_9 TaxID=1797530 RepID=A0A1G1XKS1_9BACT|nr:MAG: hypothetical protein A2Y82_05290 [Candidatus Buchananbacteria bacterium RBG_13_36_9]